MVNAQADTITAAKPQDKLSGENKAVAPLRKLLYALQQ